MSKRFLVLLLLISLGVKAALPPVIDVYATPPESQTIHEDEDYEDEEEEPIVPAQPEKVPQKPVTPEVKLQESAPKQTEPTDSDVSIASPATNDAMQAQRLEVLERQVSTIIPLVNQIGQLQQQVQDLRGQLESAKNTAITKNDEPKQTPLSGKQNNIDRSSKTPVQTVKKPTPESLKTSALAYQTAFNFLKESNYPAATNSFENFIKNYPANDNTPNACYFLGQLYLLQDSPNESIGRFQTFLRQYPDDSKVPDAMLQLGLAYFAKGDRERALQTFEKVIARYPESDAANSAKIRLQQLHAH
jgi:tol-pal system protein YbgF